MKKGIQFLLVGATAMAVVLVISFASQPVYAATVGPIERLMPAESMPVESGGGGMLWAPSEPFNFDNDTGYVERLLPAESITPETYMGGGETSRMLSATFKFTNDAGHIERLRPAESVE